MFSKQPRCIYENNQLSEVICQLRFPEILTISANAPADLQNEIRDIFPQFSVTQEILPAPGTPKPVATPNYRFSSEDGLWRVNLTSKFISLSCGQYRCWEEFAKMLDKPLAAFIKLYHPAYFERIGLRYLNFISRNALQLEDTPFTDLFMPCWLGPMAQNDVDTDNFSFCGIDTQFAIHGGCQVKIHAGPGMIKRNGQQDPEKKFIFDMDLFMPGHMPVNLSAGALQTLHSQAFPIFRDAITDTLHEAMEPDNG